MRSGQTDPDPSQICGVYHDDATFVELSTSEGDIGVYPGHIPLTAVVVPCVLSIHNGNDVKKAAVHGGIIEILKG